MKVSAKILISKGACPEQVKVFKKVFGAATVRVTEVLCVEHANDFDWNWAARQLLPAPLDADYKAKLAALFGQLAETVD